MPVASEYRSLLLLFAIAGVIVLALTLWFTVKLSAPMVETDMALVPHPPLHRVARRKRCSIAPRNFSVLQCCNAAVLP